METAERSRRRPRATSDVVGVLLLAVGGCAAAEEPRALVSVVADVETTELVQFGERLFGSEEQRRAGELVAYHSFNDAVAACMTERGSEHQAAAFVGDIGLVRRDGTRPDLLVAGTSGNRFRCQSDPCPPSAGRCRGS